MKTFSSDDEDPVASRSERRRKLLGEYMEGDDDRKKVWDLTGGPTNVDQLSKRQFTLKGADLNKTASYNRAAANTFGGFVNQMDSRLKKAGTGNKRAAGVYSSPRLGMSYDKALLPFKPDTRGAVAAPQDEPKALMAGQQFGAIESALPMRELGPGPGPAIEVGSVERIHPMGKAT